jgi:hypothetical protein
MPTPQKTAAGLGSFLKGNAKFMYGTGAVAAAFVAWDIKNILDSDNKLKALLKTAKDFILIRVGLAGVFKGVGDAIKGLVRETGSLDAALKKLSQMQQAARGLQQWTGGLNAAKQRVSELYRLSTRQPFKFEELAEANKSLEIFTRGAYSSVQATQEVGKAALASGNSIQDTARAVGMFYDNLRSGVPIRGAAEQLRQMGLISQATADNLSNLNETGADTSTVFAELTQSLAVTGRGAEGYKDTIEGVTEAHDKAVEALKESFGAPFTKGEIDNTKNMTKAMQEITPTVEVMSKGAAMLYGGFSTAASGIVKYIASSKLLAVVLEGLGVAIGVATVALGVFGTIIGVTLLPVLYGLTTGIAGLLIPALTFLGVAETTAASAAVALGVALNVLAAVTVYGAIAGFVVALGGAAYHMYQLEKASKKAAEAQRKGWTESTSEIGKQIAAVTTLAQKNEVLAKAVQAQITAEKELKALQEKRASGAATPRLAPITPGGIKAPRGDEYDTEKQVKAAEANVAAKKRLVEEAIKLSGLDSEHLDALIKAEELTKAEREDRTKSVGQRHAEVQAALESARSAELQRSDMDVTLIQKRAALKTDKESFQDRNKSVKDRADEVSKLRAEGKAEEASALEERYKRAGAPQAQDKIQSEIEKEKLRKQETDIAQTEAQRIKVGLDVGNKQSSTYLQARVEQLQAAQKADLIVKDIEGLQQDPEKNKEAIRSRQTDLRNERIKAQGVTEFKPAELARAKQQLEIALGREAKGPELAAQEQQINLQKFQINNEIAGQRARTRGDIKAAQASEDLSRFTSHFDQLFAAGFGKPEASRIAAEQTGADIAEEYSGRQIPVSGLTAMGGGGNLPGINAATEIARRQEALQQKMVDYLAILAGGEEQPQQTQAVFGR